MAEPAKQSRAYITEKRKKIVTDFIHAIQNETHPLTQDYRPGEYRRPYNLSSGKPYVGANLLSLSAQGRTDPRWLTYRQAQGRGAQVRRGEKGTNITGWVWTVTEPELDSDGKEYLVGGKKQCRERKLEKPLLRVFTVFNGEQVAGLEPYSAEPVPTDAAETANQKVRDILAKSNAKITHDQENRAFYNLAHDEIHLAPPEKFVDESAYLATAFHELGHWTGHASRMNRDMHHPHGSEKYAREELRAEFFSFFANAEYDIGYDIKNHKGYLKSWVKLLKNDPDELFRASAEADKMLTYVKEITQEKAVNTDTKIAAATEKSEVRPAMGEGDQVYLFVPYADKDEFKKLCIKHGFLFKFDKSKKQWCATAKDKGSDFSVFNHWATSKIKAKPSALDYGAIVNEFADALAAGGLLLDGAPVMDGKLHRVAVEGGKLGSKDGAYQGHIDNPPSGWYQNHRLGEVVKWKSDMKVPMTSGQTADMKADIAQKKAKREQDLAAEREAALKSLKNRLDTYPAPSEGDVGYIHSYLQAKHIDANSYEDTDLKINRQNSLVIPLYNIHGELQSAQWIAENGDKGVYKHTRLTGSFTVVGGSYAAGDGLPCTTPKVLSELERSKHPEIVLAEGYSTAKTISQECGRSVICTCSSGNLEHVAKAFRNKYPNARILICGDKNAGKDVKSEKYAQRAAEAAGGVAIIPRFPPRVEGTDFNDLVVNRGAAGRKSVMNQVEDGMDQASQIQLDKIQESTQEPPRPIVFRDIYPETSREAGIEM